MASWYRITAVPSLLWSHFNHSQPSMRRIRDFFVRLFQARRLRKGLAWFAQKFVKLESSIPYCVVFSQSIKFSFPPDFSISEYRGLLSCQAAKDTLGSKVKIIVYWRDEDHFRAHGGRLNDKLVLGAPDSAGPVIDVRQQRESFLKRHSLAAEVIGIAALFGALSGIRDYYSV